VVSGLIDFTSHEHQAHGGHSGGGVPLPLPSLAPTPGMPPSPHTLTATLCSHEKTYPSCTCPHTNLPTQTVALTPGNWN
jgi:hypothetical protein